MNINDVMLLSCDLFNKGKFKDCSELLQHTLDDCDLNKIKTQSEIEFILLRNNSLVCNCLKILSEINIEYVGKMAEFINMSKLYLYEKHIPLELRINFVCNMLYWYWLKPIDIPDYCYNEIITLVDECLHEVIHENGKSILKMSLHVGKEQDILHSLEYLSNNFLNLEPILVIQCLEISQILLLVFLFRNCYTSLLENYTVKLIKEIKNIMCIFKYKKSNHVINCFKLGFSKMNSFLDTEYISTIIVSSHVSLCVKYILENQYRHALRQLSTIDQYLNSNDELYCLVCYLKAFANFNLEEFEVTLYYLSQMADCLMDPFIKSRCYLLLGRTYSKMGENELAISTFDKLKDSEFNKVVAYYMSQHYEKNNMHFAQMMVLEQVIKDCLNKNNDKYNNISISYTSKVLFILHPQPDLTRKQLIYMAAKKKYDHSSYKLAASAYLSILKLNEFELYVSNLVIIPSSFMLKHEAVVVLIKAHEMKEAFKLCKSLIEEFEPGCNMWKSDLFWANELNDYNFNIVAAMLLAETGYNKDTDFILEALNKSFNCLYSKISCGDLRENTNFDENIRTLRRVLIGKILLLKATILSKLNREEDCEAAFQKALSYNAGDEDIVYLYSKWLEHKEKVSQSMDVRNQFDRTKINTIVCENVVIHYLLENKHGLEDAIIRNNVIDDLFVDTDEVIEINHEMDSADDDIFNDLFLD